MTDFHENSFFLVYNDFSDMIDREVFCQCILFYRFFVIDTPIRQIHMTAIVELNKSFYLEIKR